MVFHRCGYLDAEEMLPKEQRNMSGVSGGVQHDSREMALWVYEGVRVYRMYRGVQGVQGCKGVYRGVRGCRGVHGLQGVYRVVRGCTGV